MWQLDYTCDQLAEIVQVVARSQECSFAMLDAPIIGARDITAGKKQSAPICTTARWMVCWGENHDGQLGNG